MTARDFCGVAGTPAARRGWGCVKVVSEPGYWQPCMFKLKVHTYEVIQSIKQLIFLANTALCQEEDVEVVLGESFQ